MMRRVGHARVVGGGGRRGAGGFTLIELVTVIVILGALSAVAIPVYLDYSMDARKSACKGALGSMRAAIANYHSYSATAAGGGISAYPSINELTTVGTVLQDEVPPNPFDDQEPANNVVDATGKTKGTLVGGDKGWCYNPTNGQIWANSTSKTAFENTY